jgi:ADP-heptose:LPS heptosyltransferase
VTGPVATVLALRALGLGDALTGVPALRGLRRAWPQARLVLAAPAAVGQLLLTLGVVDETLDAGPLQPVRWPSPDPPDVAVNLHGRGPQSHCVLASLRPGRLVAFACTEAGHLDGPAWTPDEHEVDRWCRLVRWAGGSCGREDLRLEPPGPRGDLVVVHPGAASASRRWPVDRWADVVRHLAGSGRHVAVTGTDGEASLCDPLAGAGAENLCGRLSLADLARTVATAGLVLCGDTGVAHLATAYGTPSVVLFGPTSPSTWGPAVDAERHVVLWHGRDGEAPGNPHGHQVDPRLERVTVDEVLASVDSVARPATAIPAPATESP